MRIDIRTQVEADAAPDGAELHIVAAVDIVLRKPGTIFASVAGALAIANVVGARAFASVDGALAYIRKA